MAKEKKSYELEGKITLNTYKQRVFEVGVEDEHIRPGAFYSFQYNFMPNNRGTKFEITRWYDFFPLIFVLDRRVTKKGDLIITGINFHHLPHSIRSEWYNNLDKFYGGRVSERPMFIKLLPAQLINLQRKTYYAIRNYTEDVILHPVRIPSDKIESIMDITVDTHYGVSQREIENRLKRLPMPKNIININKMKLN